MSNRYSHKVSIILELVLGGKELVRKRELLYEVIAEDMARSFMDRVIEEQGCMFTLYYFYDLGGNEIHHIRFMNAVNFDLGMEIKIGGRYFTYIGEKKFKEKECPA